MPENGEKTTIGLIGKKASLHAQHTFFLHFCAVVLHNYNVKLSETSWLYASSGGNIVHVLVHFFFTIAHFKLVFSPLLQNFVFSSRKNVSVVFSLMLQLSFSLRFAGLQRYFLFLYFQICGHDNTYYSKLNTLENTDTEIFSDFRFCLY